MKYEIINRQTRCRLEVEATCPARAVDQSIWPWEICEVRLLGKEGEDEHYPNGRREVPELRTPGLVGGVNAKL